LRHAGDRQRRTVPISCIISIGRGPASTDTDPPLALVNESEFSIKLAASNRSAGSSPRLIWTVVFAGAGLLGVVIPELPPHRSASQPDLFAFAGRER
jgi:hypothetical protein